MNSHAVHKLLIGTEDFAVYNDLVSRGAVVGEIDYGSFKLVQVNEQAIGGRDSLVALSLPVHDEQDLINLNGFVLDTNEPGCFEVRYRRICARPTWLTLLKTAPRPGVGSTLCSSRVRSRIRGCES